MTKEIDCEKACSLVSTIGGNPLRLKLISLISKEHLSVKELVTEVGTSQSNISQHLRIFRDQGLVTSKKVSNQVYYRCEREDVADFLRFVRKNFKKS